MNNYDEEDEEEKFFDSIDRIQSASGSETEDDNDLTSTSTVNTSLFPNYANPHFQMAISMYEVWIAEPGSIKERRMRLLQELGLSSDRGFSRLPSISRQSDRDSSEEEEGKGDGECSTSGRTIGASWDTELGRSVSCDEFLRRPDPSLVSHVSGSRSDGALDLISASTSISDSSLCDGNQCNFSFSPLPPPVQSNGSSTRTHFVNNHSLLDSKISSSKHERNTLHSTATTNIVHSKPPVWKNPCPFSSKEQPPQSSSLIQGSGKSSSSSSTSSSSQGFDEIEKVKDDARNSFALDDSKSRSGDRVSNGELENGLHDPEVNGVKEEVVCTIKNLDNGKEFIVNEFREDGMWNKLREVETGRQLTMEEFEMSVGHSPIVQELMRRENVEELGNARRDGGNSNGNAGSKSKKKGGWFKSIKLVANTMTGHRDRRSSDEKDTSSEKGGRRSSSATDDSQDVLFHSPQRIKVRQYGKSCKELTALYMSQEIKAHKGSIWSIKFSLDGRYLASAGEDCAIHVWQVMELERKGDVLMEKPEDASIMHPYFFPCGSPEPALLLSNMDSHLENKKRGKISSSNRRSANLEHVFFPENMFLLSEKPVCSFQGHLADVFDLSWSKSQYLLSSSMDKTVRLWHMSSNSCLKMFSHSDYVTCIQFNPVDDRYFISGSLDSKVRIWSIPDRQVVDWSDLHEMVTAACYTPDGQGALVGSHKGSCRLYNTSGNKLNQEGQIDLQSKKKRSHVKKITGFQFAPGNSSEVLITSADSRIRVFYGVDLVHKFKGFRNTNSQITASLTANGKFVISASEDSHVYVWRYDSDSRMGRTKGVTITRSYEDFHCRDVSAAIPWPGFSNDKGGAVDGGGSTDNHQLNQTCWAKASTATASTPVEEANAHLGSAMAYGSAASPLHHSISSTNNFFLDRVSATWPEEKLLATINKRSPQSSDFFSNGMVQGRSAWGLVIVTAGLGGEIKVFQNFGLPVRI